ncbi:peptidoglycan DD-metalloendopeptidase family protein [Streptomyces sp. NPDC059092]|uniref:peptidoglycan DD-metalloendopeptidase family protein n=1 Tax=Streptomyces sp. NPDC059092 TaxID=3346725 RepID=UPI00367534CC
MNDQHAHAGYTAYDGYQNGSFETDPLFGSLPDGPGGTGGYGDVSASTGQYATVQADHAAGGHLQVGHPQAGHSGQYDNTQWDTGAHHQATGYDAYGTQAYDTSGQWPTVSPDAPTGSGYPQDATGEWGSGAWHQVVQPNGPGDTGQFDSTQFNGAQFNDSQYGGYDTPGTTATAHATFDPVQLAALETAQFEAAQFEAAPLAYEATAQWTTPTFDTGSYDATAWNGPGTAHEDTSFAYGAPGPEPERAYGAEPGYEPEPGYDTESGYTAEPEPTPAYEAEHGYETVATDTDAVKTGPGADAEHRTGADDFAPDSKGLAEPAAPDDDPHALHMAATMATPAVTVAPVGPRRSGGAGNGSRGRRRTPAKRSALLTVAVPSACVMGVAGIAAASVGGLAGEDTKDDSTTTASAEDTASAKPVAAAANNKLDTQLAALSADARDFGDRASRTQERIDLQERKAEERKRAAEEAARKEAARPKFALPVSQHGLSAYYGQAGVNWMSMHTGIDFPVSYGTPVLAASDGTVRTQYNSAYGNMAIVTSADGTETWYCHLSSTKIRSGSVKAGDVIAYSGNSGNSTGPHLHFEVRPGGGSAIDPLAWLRSHGLDPT